MLMNNEINLLILDEPTNHLDLPSREWIENAVGQYGETLIFISHDRYFINRFATRIWELRDGAFTDFPGTYAEFCTRRAAGPVAAVAKKTPRASRKPKKMADPQKALDRLEREIEKLESVLNDIGRQKDEFSTDYEKLMELDAREQETHESMDKLYSEWDALAQ